MKKQTIKKLFASSILMAAAFIAFGYTTVYAQDDADCASKACRKALAAARAATAQYHDYQTALADGYVPTGPCVALPNGWAMGFHHTKFSLVDFNVAETAPEVLIYLPDEDGEMQLVALEYLVPFTGSNPAPSLYGGRVFEGPNTVPFPSYALHVWAWRNNPLGMFADFNPKLTCPES